MTNETVELIAFQMLTSDLRRGRIIDVDDPELWSDDAIVEVARGLDIAAVSDDELVRIRAEYEARRAEAIDDEDSYDDEDDDA